MCHSIKKRVIEHIILKWTQQILMLIYPLDTWSDLSELFKILVISGTAATTTIRLLSPLTLINKNLVTSTWKCPQAQQTSLWLRYTLSHNSSTHSPNLLWVKLPCIPLYLLYICPYYHLNNKRRQSISKVGWLSSLVTLALRKTLLSPTLGDTRWVLDTIHSEIYIRVAHQCHPPAPKK